MTCERFQNMLARVMEGSLAEPARRETLVELARHAADCDACGSCADLLSLLALPPGQRDLVDPPPAGYWEEFDRRLRLRLEAPRAKRAIHPARWAAAAVLILAVGAALIVGVGRWSDPAASRALLDDQVAEGEALSPALERALADVVAADVTEELEFLDGLSGGWEARTAGQESGLPEPEGWLFPTVDDLEPDERRELLEWLRDQAESHKGVT